MTCGKLFLLREKGIALVKQDKWTCPLPPAPKGELTENSIRTSSSFSSASTVVSKDKIKSQPQERTLYISCWLFRALRTGLAASTEMEKKKELGVDSISVILLVDFFLIENEFSGLN